MLDSYVLALRWLYTDSIHYVSSHYKLVFVTLVQIYCGDHKFVYIQKWKQKHECHNMWMRRIITYACSLWPQHDGNPQVKCALAQLQINLMMLSLPGKCTINFAIHAMHKRVAISATSWHYQWDLLSWYQRQTTAVLACILHQSDAVVFSKGDERYSDMVVVNSPD